MGLGTSSISNLIQSTISGIESPIQWSATDEGWILKKDTEDRLMMVTFPPHLVLDPRITQIQISQEPSATVNFSGCTLGPGWEACYTPEQ